MADESKGKGKAPARSSGRDEEQDARSDQATRSNSTAQSLAAALRTTMASSQLSSVMQTIGASGKHDPQRFGSSSAERSGELRDWLVQDLRSSPTAADSTVESSRTGTFRSSASGVEEASAEAEKMFEHFQRGLMLNEGSSETAAKEELAQDTIGQGVDKLEHSWDAAQQAPIRWQATGLDPTTARRVDTYTDLDAPLHASVRKDQSVAPAQASNASFVVAAPLVQSDDIIALLDAEESHAQASAPTPTTRLSETVLSQFSPRYRAPSPSHPSFTREQAALHLALAEAQASTQSQRDLVIPRPDNRAAQQGVYARTPQDALSSIFASTGRQESSHVTESESVDDRGRAVIRKITRWFGASTYIDDVYGVSPVLKETIEEALKPDNSQENRDKAVRRLESLWRHLSASEPQTDTRANWVDGWLLKNT